VPQIVTLCMNPALDVTTSTAAVRPTSKLRCALPRFDPGGGGINVARVAHVLGAEALAVFPAGGPAGEEVLALLGTEGLAVQRIPIAGRTRESFTVNETGTGDQFRFVLPGPELSAAEQDACIRRLRDAAGSAQIVVASGSLPPGVPDDFYQQVADVCADLAVKLLLDASGGGLERVTSGVYLVKPSLRELREYTGRELETEAEQFDAATELVDRGVAECLLVSLGAEGALLVTAEGGLRYRPVSVPHGSSVGAGDAMVAGVAAGLTRGWPLSEAVRLGIAAGAAVHLTPGTAACTREDTERLLVRTAPPVAMPTAQ
jgi:6-phosphofructokinase 2